MRGAAPDKTPDHTDPTAHAFAADNRPVLVAVVGLVPDRVVAELTRWPGVMSKPVAHA